MSRVWRQFMVVCLGVVAAALGAGAWRYRLELFVAPQAWHKLLRAAGADFDEAARRMVALRRPGFEGGTRFHLEKMRMRGGGIAHLLTWRTNGQTLDSYLLLDGRGRVIESELDLYEGHRVDRDAAKAFDVLWALSGLAEVVELSVDERGWVPESQRHEPLWLGNRLSWPLDTVRLRQLLASPHSGDLLRALHLIERASCEGADQAWDLTRHGDPKVRERAAEVLGGHSGSRTVVAALLADPVPAVRIAALNAVAKGRAWEERVLSLSRDPDQSVRQTAHYLLLRSRDLSLARASYCRLIEERMLRDLGYVFGGERRFHEHLDTPESAEALVAWLEEDPESPQTPLWELVSTRSAHLRPLLGRLLSIYRGLEDSHVSRGYVAAALAALADAQADAAVVEILSRPCDKESGLHTSVLRRLLNRPEAPADLRLTAAVEQMGNPVGLPQEFDRYEADPGFLAALCLVKWEVDGAADCFLSRCADPDNRWLEHSFWEHSGLPERLLPALERLPESKQPRVNEIRQRLERERAAEEEGRLRRRQELEEEE